MSGLSIEKGLIGEERGNGQKSSGKGGSRMPVYQPRSKLLKKKRSQNTKRC